MSRSTHCCLTVLFHTFCCYFFHFHLFVYFAFLCCQIYLIWFDFHLHLSMHSLSLLIMWRAKTAYSHYSLKPIRPTVPLFKIILHIITKILLQVGFHSRNLFLFLKCVSHTAHVIATGWRKKRGHVPISVAWKLVNFCNIICWTVNTVINFMFKNFIALLSFIHIVQIDLSITQ